MERWGFQSSVVIVVGTETWQTREITNGGGTRQILPIASRSCSSRQGRHHRKCHALAGRYTDDDISTDCDWLLASRSQGLINAMNRSKASMMLIERFSRSRYHGLLQCRSPRSSARYARGREHNVARHFRPTPTT